MPALHVTRHEEYIRRKRKQIYLRAGVIGVCICVCIGLASFLSRQSFVRIMSIELHGGVLVTQKDVESRVRDEISGSYFWLFPKDNTLLYPHDDIEKVLLTDLKRIKTIDIHIVSGVLRVDISERTPVAQWCNSSLYTGTTTPSSHSEIADGECYFMDDQSTIFAQAPSFSGDAYFKYYGAISRDPVGATFIASSTEFEKISRFIESVRDIGLRPQYIVIRDGGEYSLTLSGGGVLIFNNKESFDTILENLRVVLRTPILSPHGGQNIPVEYIDLRYGNKVFYKLK